MDFQPSNSSANPPTLGVYSSRSKKPWNLGKKSGSVSVDNKVCKCIYFGSDEFNVRQYWFIGNSRDLTRLLDPLSISPLHIALRTTRLETNLGNFHGGSKRLSMSVPRLSGSTEGFWKPFGDLFSSYQREILLQWRHFSSTILRVTYPSFNFQSINPYYLWSTSGSKNWSLASDWTGWRLDTSGVLTIALSMDYLGTDSNGGFYAIAKQHATWATWVNQKKTWPNWSTSPSIWAPGFSRVRIWQRVYCFSSHSLALNQLPQK